mgnify:CR=1 FL=1
MTDYDALSARIGALARGESISIVGDQWGNPTYVHDLARALVELSRQRVSGLLHMGGTTFLTREELVRQVAAHFQLDASGIETVTTAVAGQAAPRPLRSCWSASPLWCGSRTWVSRASLTRRRLQVACESISKSSPR